MPPLEGVTRRDQGAPVSAGPWNDQNDRRLPASSAHGIGALEGALTMLTMLTKLTKVAGDSFPVPDSRSTMGTIGQVWAPT